MAKENVQPLCIFRRERRLVQRGDVLLQMRDIARAGEDDMRPRLVAAEAIGRLRDRFRIAALYEKA